MKKILFIALLFCANSVVAQHYYMHQNQKISFTEDSTINLVSYSGNFQNNNINLDSIKQLNPDNKIQGFKKDQFILRNTTVSMATIRKTYKDAYISKLYINSQNNQKDIVFFLPKIILQLKPGASYKPILDKYKGQLNLLEENNGLCKFSCDVSYSDDVLKILDDMYKSIEIQSIMDWCEPVFYFNLNFYSDPLYSQQYYLKNSGQTGGKSGIDINVEPAWNITKGSANIRIAIVDEGVEAHEDLGTLLPGYTVGGGNGTPQNTDNSDSKAHGEACAGIIAAVHDNNLYIKGIAPNCKIVPVNIAPYFSTHIDASTGQATSFASNEDIATALNWAWHNADVLSCSWGGGIVSTYIENAIDSAKTYGRNGKGCVLVFASGNNYPYISNVAFPANYNDVIAVGAINKNGNIWNYSQRGSALSLVAPSGDVDLKGDVVTIDRMGSNGYNSGNYMTNFGGTSAACPQVAGVAALILSVRPDLTQEQVRQVIESTCTKLPDYLFVHNPSHSSGTWNNEVGYGLVNAYAAVNAALALSLALPVSISGPSFVCPSSTVTFTVKNAPTGYTWKCSSNLFPVSGNPGTFTTSSSAGNGWVSINSGNTELARKNIGVGNGISISGPDNISSATSTVYYAEPDCSNYNYTWILYKSNYNLIAGEHPDTCYLKSSATIRSTYTSGQTNAYILQVYAGNNIVAEKQIGVFNYSLSLVGLKPGDPTTPILLNISPNPASSEVTIDIEEDTDDTPDILSLQPSTMKAAEPVYTVSIVDIYGALVYKGEKRGNKFDLPVSSLHNGIYSVIISDGTTTLQKKLIVKH